MTNCNGFFFALMLLVGCSALDLENSDKDQVQAAELIIPAFQKSCDRQADCQVMDKDCCSAGDFIAMNKQHWLSTRAAIRINCRDKERDAHAKGENLCADKVPTSAVPNAVCENRVCEVKAEDAAADKPALACEKDSDCTVRDEDCCQTGTNLVALHRKDLLSWDDKNKKKCRAEFSENKSLCAGKKANWFKLHRARARCDANECKLKTP